VKAKKPHWPMDRVKALAAEGAIYVMHTRARDFFTTRYEQ
jgi:hypothetical protein